MAGNGHVGSLAMSKGLGGTLLAPFLFLTVLPAAIGVFSRRQVKQAEPSATVAEAH